MWRVSNKDGAEKKVPTSVTNPMAKRLANVVTSIASGGIWAKIALGTVVFDTDNMTATADSIVIQHAGKYLVEGSAHWDGNTTGVRELRVRLNNNYVPNTNAYDRESGDTNGNSQRVVFVADFVAGDVLTLEAAQSSGVSLNINSASPYAADLSVTKIDGAVVSYVGVPGSLVGQELAMAQASTTQTSTQTVEANATTLMTLPSFTVDGSTPVVVDVTFPAVYNSITTALCYTLLYDNGVCVGYLGQSTSPAAGQGISPFKGEHRYTPSAGSHVLTVKGFVSAASTGTWAGDVGGPGKFVPALARVTRAA